MPIGRGQSPTSAQDVSSSYVGTPFGHDIFVTYSHGDADGDGKSLLKTYSKAVADAVEEYLKVIPEIGPRVRLFRDEDHREGQGLDPHAALTRELQDSIGASALLLVLMSPHYLNSNWCTDERSWWHEKAVEFGLSPADRLVLAKIWDADAMDWPEQLIDSRGEKIVGRRFYDPETPWPFAWPKPDVNVNDEPNQKFKNALEQLVRDIVQKLRTTRAAVAQINEERAAAARLQAAGGQIIYLHGRSPDQETEWRDWSGRLMDNDFLVQPAQPDAVHGNIAEIHTVRSQRVDRLCQCDAVCLLGTDPQALNDDIIVIGRQDRHEAKDKSGHLLPCAVLDTNRLAERYPIVRNNAEKLDIDWIDASAPDLPPRIFPWFQGSR